MNQSEMDAIRKRDSEWKDGGSARFSVAARDRRALLRFIDELEAAAEDVRNDLAAIRRVHREHYAPRPPSSPPLPKP